MLKTGFHFGDDATSVHKCMTPFIVGKSKIHSRFKIAEKKVIEDPKTKKVLLKKFHLKYRNGDPFVPKGLKGKTLRNQLARLDNGAI